MESILERILAGEDPEKIGKEFADELNNAVAEKKRKDEEAKSKEKKENELNNLARIVAVALSNYINAADPVLAKTMKDEIDGETMREILDTAIDGIKACQEVDSFFNKFDAEKPVKKTKVKVSTADDEIAKFLKHFGLM